jgi:hypothetical protein
MRRHGPRGQETGRQQAPALTRAVVAIISLVLLLGSALTSTALAQTGPDKSEVVMVLDFSASILDDKATRNRFGAAVEAIADRVDATSADLVVGDTTVSIVQFASRAADQPGCAEMKLLGSQAAVTQFSTCLRAIATQYRRGLTSGGTRKFGIDTNYVAALQQAAKHVPADATRPTVILFTDGKHEVKGVPASQVPVTLQQLFGTRSPFALLPVGMGLDPKERGALEAGLLALRIIRDMPACVSGTVFEWPTVVFGSAAEAGNAVAVALQNATCTFTVESSPTPIPTAPPTPGVVSGIRLTPSDGRIDLTWAPLSGTGVPVVDYRARCRAGEGDWIESTEGTSLEPKATIEGLTNGTAYTCEVAAVGADAEGEFTAAATTATPLPVPAPPAKPSVARFDQALEVSTTAADPAAVTGFHYECSADNGGTWPAAVDVDVKSPAGQVAGLTNGVSYVCRAFAVNGTGQSEASPLSDAASPCASTFECNSLLVPLLGLLGSLALLGILAALVALYRGRTRGYVVAVIDVIHTINLGSGTSVGIRLVRAPHSRVVTDVVADKGRKADFRIKRKRGDRLEVTDRDGRRVVESGEPVVVTDTLGSKHELTLRAFATNSALAAPGGR